jgi:hypothetical protein
VGSTPPPEDEVSHTPAVEGRGSSDSEDSSSSGEAKEAGEVIAKQTELSPSVASEESSGSLGIGAAISTPEHEVELST